MNRLQEELVSILESFIKICEEQKLTWFLVNGSALGAEKYSGFIPWDDDMDVAMPRKDYEIFCQKANDLLPAHLFLQNYKTEKAFPFFYSKLRNVNTTFVEEGVQHLDICHGIYIDVFPIDGYPDGKLSQVILNGKWKILSSMQFCGFENRVNLKKRVLRFLGYHKKTAKTLSRMEKTARKYHNTKQLCDYGDRYGKGRYAKEIYEQLKSASFEHLQVYIPAATDEYLRHKYGNWKAELPKEQQKSHHHTVVCDLDTPCKQYKQ